MADARGYVVLPRVGRWPASPGHDRIGHASARGMPWERAFGLIDQLGVSGEELDQRNGALAGPPAFVGPTGGCDNIVIGDAEAPTKAAVFILIQLEPGHSLHPNRAPLGATHFLITPTTGIWMPQHLI